MSSLRCFTCKIEKPVTQFSRNVGRPSGYSCYCLICTKARRRIPHAMAVNRVGRMRYYNSHKEQCRAYVSLETQRERRRIGYYRDVERSRQRARVYNKAYAKRNPLFFRVWAKRARARRRANVKISDFTMKQWIAKLELFSNRCCYCMGLLDDSTWPNPRYPEEEHMTPLTNRGGQDTDNNIVPACTKCNRAKSERTYDEFMGFLPPLADDLPKPIKLDKPLAYLDLT